MWWNITEILAPPLNVLYFLWYAAEWLIRFGALAVVPLKRSPAAAAGWLLLISFIPGRSRSLFPDRAASFSRRATTPQP